MTSRFEIEKGIVRLLLRQEDAVSRRLTRFWAQPLSPRHIIKPCAAYTLDLFRSRPKADTLVAPETSRLRTSDSSLHAKICISSSMVKRSRIEDVVDSSRDEKRLRTTKVDRFSRLSDELILRVLPYLPVSQLVLCQR